MIYIDRRFVDTSTLQAMNAAYMLYTWFWEEFEATGHPQAHAAARLWYARYLKAKTRYEEECRS